MPQAIHFNAEESRGLNVLGSSHPPSPAWSSINTSPYLDPNPVGWPFAQVVDSISTDPVVSGPWTQEVPDTTTHQQDPANEHVSRFDHFVSRLYPDHELNLLLKYWFDELETFYPCIDRIDFYERLSILFIEHCRCENGMTQIPKEPRNIYLAALTCGMAALATYLGGVVEPNQRTQGDNYYLDASMSWFLESRNLLDCISTNSQEPNIDLLRLHMVEVLYMNIREEKAGISKAMTLAVDLAFALRLNDESEWTSCSTRSKEYRRLLWWTVYHMDRRVALTIGRPILIHEEDFIVGEYTTKSKEIYMSNSPVASNLNQRTEPRILLVQWTRPSALPQDWFDYLLFLLRWDKLVANFWETCFCLRALYRPDIGKLVMADELLMHIHSSIPSGLVWDSRRLPTFMQLGDVDRAFRLRLIIFESVNMLRLSVRSRTINSHPSLQSHDVVKSAQITEGIASNTMDSIIDYLNVRKNARPWAAYASLLLVEVTSHIAPFLKNREGSPTKTTHEVVASIVRAQSYLEAMKMRVSCRAAEKLASVLVNVNGIPTARIPRTMNPDFAEAGQDNRELSWEIGHVEGDTVFEAATFGFDLDDFC